MGIISDIAFKQGDQPPVLPIAVIVQFDSTYTGPSFLSDLPRCVPIISETNQSDLYGQCIKYKDTFLYRVLEEKRLDYALPSRNLY